LSSNVATVTITIAPVNDAPVADNNAVTLDEDAAPYDFVLTASDAEGDALGYRVTVQPQKGVLECNDDACTYTPSLNQNGDDSFHFVANDGELDSPEATVTISLTPINDAPVASEQVVNTLQDTDAIVVLAGMDVEGDALSFTITTQPTEGQLVCNNEACTYSPNAGFVGQDQFEFTANDGTTTSEPATVTIRVEPSDGDGDGTFNNDDNCPLVSNDDQADLDQDGAGDACDDDDDNDGSPDGDDNCPLDDNANQLNADQDTEGDVCDPDDDNDGVEDGDDNCPMLPNNDQADTNQDGQGDACSDDDGDGVADGDDLCPLDADPAQADLDQDGAGDACDPDDDEDGVNDDVDTCAMLANPDQTDSDDDGAGNDCDDDDDGDGVADADDNCPLDTNPDQTDEDQDGLGAACDDDDKPVVQDADADDDEVADDADNCPNASNPDQADADQDGLGTACDEDEADDDDDDDDEGQGQGQGTQGKVSGGGSLICAQGSQHAPVGHGLWLALGALGLALVRRATRKRAA
jgi:hypothetical protein